MTTRLVLAALLLQLPLGYAEPVSISVRDDGLELARQAVVDSSAVVEPSHSRTIYLNKSGVTLMPGINDSRANRSSLVTSTVVVPPWTTSAETWAKTVSCVRVMFARFDVKVTDVDPRDEPHIEAVFGGSPALVGMGPRTAGVAPFSTGCKPIENAIVFAFTDVLRDDPRTVCEVIAQEIAHGYGLDHELLASDPMTYLPYIGARSFQDELAACGEDNPRSCGLPGWPSCRDKQNSVALLFDRVGRAGAGDRVPPVVAITSPATGATVEAGFQVDADVHDETEIRLATLSVDGVVVDTLASEPWTFSTSPMLGAGSYRVTVTATDGANEQSSSIDVVVASGGDTSLVGCAASRGGIAWPFALALWLGWKRLARFRGGARSTCKSPRAQ